LRLHGSGGGRSPGPFGERDGTHRAVVHAGFAPKAPGLVSPGQSEASPWESSAPLDAPH
jgi:hypothetical protein